MPPRSAACGKEHHGQAACFGHRGTPHRRRPDAHRRRPPRKRRCRRHGRIEGQRRLLHHVVACRRALRRFVGGLRRRLLPGLEHVAGEIGLPRQRHRQGARPRIRRPGRRGRPLPLLRRRRLGAARRRASVEHLPPHRVRRLLRLARLPLGQACRGRARDEAGRRHPQKLRLQRDGGVPVPRHQTVLRERGRNQDEGADQRQHDAQRHRAVGRADPPVPARRLHEVHRHRPLRRLLALRRRRGRPSHRDEPVGQKAQRLPARRRRGQHPPRREKAARSPHAAQPPDGLPGVPALHRRLEAHERPHAALGRRASRRRAEADVSARLPGLRLPRVHRRAACRPRPPALARERLRGRRDHRRGAGGLRARRGVAVRHHGKDAAPRAGPPDRLPRAATGLGIRDHRARRSIRQGRPSPGRVRGAAVRRGEPRQLAALPRRGAAPAPAGGLGHGQIDVSARRRGSLRERPPGADIADAGRDGRQRGGGAVRPGVRTRRRQRRRPVRAARRRKRRGRGARARRANGRRHPLRRRPGPPVGHGAAFLVHAHRALADARRGALPAARRRRGGGAVLLRPGVRGASGNDARRPAQRGSRPGRIRRQPHRRAGRARERAADGGLHRRDPPPPPRAVPAPAEGVRRPAGHRAPAGRKPPAAPRRRRRHARPSGQGRPSGAPGGVRPAAPGGAVRARDHARRRRRLRRAGVPAGVRHGGLPRRHGQPVHAHRHRAGVQARPGDGPAQRMGGRSPRSTRSSASAPR